MEIQLYHSYRCRIAMRPLYNGNPVKPELQGLQGQEFLLRAMWLQDDQDTYPGEWAMGDAHIASDPILRLLSASGGHLTWIASGDVEVLEEVDVKEFEDSIAEEY